MCHKLLRRKRTPLIVWNGSVQRWKIWFAFQVTYYVVDSDRNEGKDYFEINRETGEIFTKVMFDREKQGAYALEVEARDGAPSARPNSNGQPNSGTNKYSSIFLRMLSMPVLKFDPKYFRSMSNLLGIRV